MVLMVRVMQCNLAVLLQHLSAGAKGVVFNCQLSNLDHFLLMIRGVIGDDFLQQIYFQRNKKKGFWLVMILFYLYVLTRVI